MTLLLLRNRTILGSQRKDPRKLDEIVARARGISQVQASPTSSDDGLLQVREIRDLPLRADLVVLSACETGSGKLLGEEGIASLERAFLLAGAKSVVASLWTADDIFTIALMKRFYEHLVEGTEK